MCVAAGSDVVYEDQGEPFVMREGDLVLQPPEIRHRVLESSPGLEVIEIGAPAVHATFADHELRAAERLPIRHAGSKVSASFVTWRLTRPGPPVAAAKRRKRR